MMTNINTKKNSTARGKQCGFSLIELMVVLVIVAILVTVALKIKNEVTYQTNQGELIKQTNLVASATDRWKKGRPNKTGVSMAVLCAAGAKLLDDTMCGAADDGKKANPFGGDITVAATTANPSQVDITFTGLPTDYITDLADTLAPLSANRCQTATGCATVSVTGTGIKVTL